MFGKHREKIINNKLIMKMYIKTELLYWQIIVHLDF